MKIPGVFCSIVIFVIGGCSFSQQGRMDRLRSSHPQWNQGDFENVAMGRVTAGMTEEMVREAMGNPDSITHYGGVTIWKYSYRRSDPEGRHITRAVSFVNFLNGRVISTEG